MANDQTVQPEIENFISSFLHQQFGGRPQSVNAVIRPPFIVIHLTGFLLPGEPVLLKRQETKRVVQTRDLLLNGAKPGLFRELANITGYDVKKSMPTGTLNRKAAC